MTPTSIEIDAETLLRYGWPIVCAVLGWFILRLVRQFDGHSESIGELKEDAHKDRLHASKTFAIKSDLDSMRAEIRKDFADLNSRIDTLIRELRKP